jgi:pimeloyl-ACP methyl ester carboxylesterase
MLGTRASPQRRHVAWVGTSMGGLMGMMLAARRHSPILRLVLNAVGPLVPWPALVHVKQPVQRCPGHAACRARGRPWRR